MAPSFLPKLALSGALLLLSLPAQAEWPVGAPYLGLHLGGRLPLNDWDLGPSVYQDGMKPDNTLSLQAGLRAGVLLSPRLSVEAGVTYMSLRDVEDAKGTGLIYEVDALWHLMDDPDETPFLLVGAGAYHAAGGALSTDIDPQARLGVGYRALIKPGAALRTEMHLVGSDGFTEWGSLGLEVRLGLDLWPGSLKGGEPKPEPVVELEPEPEPKAAPPEPPKPPKDTDGDRVIDAKDACPDVPGRLRTKGCPDGDMDGVADADDECPDVRGLRSHMGCVPEELAAFTGTIEGINFASGSAEITADSLPLLDNAAGVLTQFEDLQLRVEGHTDSQGDDASNQTLSEARAAAVRQYLVDKGVAAECISAKGYGETQPVADNETDEGRAANRRIEFVIVDE